MNFNIEILPIRSNLESISLDIPFTYEEIAKELGGEDWSNKSAQDSRRSILIDPSGRILKEIKKFISSNDVKEKIIDSFYTNFPSVKERWNGWSREEMKQKTCWDCVFAIDEPGYFMEPHLDTRTNVATGIIYLNKNTDEQRTTTYYTDKEGANEIKISNGFCQGVISVNDYDTWHSVRNDTSENRFIIVIVLILLTEFSGMAEDTAITL